MAIGNMDKKSGDDQSYSSGDMFAGKQIHTHTNTQTEMLTCSSHYSAFILGQSNKSPQLMPCTVMQPKI